MLDALENVLIFLGVSGAILFKIGEEVEKEEAAVKERAERFKYYLQRITALEIELKNEKDPYKKKAILFELRKYIKKKVNME